MMAHQPVRHHSFALPTALLIGAALLIQPANAQIYNWQTGEVIPGTEGATPGPGMDFSWFDSEEHNLRYADFSGGLDLSGCLFRSWLEHARFNEATLVDADFSWASLTGVDFTDAVVTGVLFIEPTERGFTSQQLYSTASYKSGDLQRIQFLNANLSGWSFAGKNLRGASFGSYVGSGTWLSDTDFSEAVLTDVNFGLRRPTELPTVMSRADMRGSSWWDVLHMVSDNTILSDGRIAGLILSAGERLPIRDYDGGIAISIDNGMTLAEGSILDIILADATWGSTITLAGAFTPDLGGTLKLGFAPGIDPQPLVGTTFDLFNWNGLLTPGDHFSQVLSLSGYQWDVSNLYTTGEVTFTGVPEPATLSLLLAGGLAYCGRRHNDRRRH